MFIHANAYVDMTYSIGIFPVNEQMIDHKPVVGGISTATVKVVSYKGHTVLGISPFIFSF
jgi:hypothetical protein